jgi:protein-S-isoprenylcysteine O-methyltransferase Ste14
MLDEFLETIVRWIGGVFAFVVLSMLFNGIYCGMKRQPGRLVGQAPGVLRSIWFYILASTNFFGGCILLWRPLPLAHPPAGQAAALMVGCLLFFPGMSLVLWGRLALGSMYFVSTGMGAELFTGHRLATNGPFAIVRHPMYVGLSIAILGGVFLYQTWTFVLLLLMPFGLIRRARHG